MKAADRRPPSRARTAVVRGALFFALWIVLLPSAQPLDVALGLASAAAAAWVSVQLLPPGFGDVHLGLLLRQMPHFAWASVAAGLDVARRALSPRVSVNPGFVACPTRVTPGVARNTFATVASLMPGTLAAGEDGDRLIVHALDVGLPCAEQMEAEERRFAPALGEDGHHG
jgi:multicomponent Na+:H+ antiporter subunit E